MTKRRQIAKQIQNKNKNNEGFTLVEVIISMTILALVSIPLLNYFSESMRYSVKMAQWQKATIAAQALMEEMKAEEKLVDKRPDGTQKYAVSYLESKGYTTTDQFEADGTGSVIYAKTDGAYDVEVEIKAELNEDKISDPQIYGIDDTKDVIAVESEQKKDAVMAFRDASAHEADEHPGTPPLTEEEVESNLQRTICVEIGMDGREYTVKVYYQYTCGVLGSISSTDLLNTRVEELKNIYILYDWMNDKDAVSVTADNEAKMNLQSDPPALYLVYQKQTEDLPDTYKLSVDGGVFGSPMKVHTNVPRVINGGLGGGTYTNAAGLTESGKPLRQLTITTKIYEADHESGEEPLAELETKKGE